MSTYLENAVSDAQDTARNFLDEIHESFFDNDGTASDDLNNDYGNGDSYHHENHVDKAYSLREACDVLEELDDYEETDSGLWDSLEPKQAISAMAAYTYGNAVYSLWSDLVKQINEDDDIVNLFEEYQNLEDTVQAEYEEKETEHEEEQDKLEEESEDYERVDFDPPFDVDDEVEKRQEEIKAKVKTRMEEVINEFNG